MLAAFFESVKYVGHLIPIAFLRVFIGASYLQLASIKFSSDFLLKPKVASQVAEALPSLQLPGWYATLIERTMIQNWQSFGFVWMALEFAIGLSYLLGYVVRPMALLASLSSLHFLMISQGPDVPYNRLLMVTHLTLAGLGAGRCLGLDYYFFKRRRGFWW